MWIARLLQKYNQKKVRISLSTHFVVRQFNREIDLNKVEETIRSGRIFRKKCGWPNKLCFARYFGKENQTYFVIVIAKKNIFEVVTVWEKKGR